MAAVGRVEPVTTQGCLPKSCHSLNLGMENFAAALNAWLLPSFVLRIINNQRLPSHRNQRPFSPL
jgi:hypothetical protein